MVHNPQTTQDDDAVAQIAIAFVSNNAVKVEEVRPLLLAIREGLMGDTSDDDEWNGNPIADLSKPLPMQTWKGIEPPRKLKPVEIERSIQPDFIVCFEDGRSYKMLKKRLSAMGLTPEEYRAKWGLPSDYPMVSPNYSASRSQLALSMGLGRKQL